MVLQCIVIFSSFHTCTDHQRDKVENRLFPTSPLLLLLLHTTLFVSNSVEETSIIRKTLFLQISVWIPYRLQSSCQKPESNKTGQETLVWCSAQNTKQSLKNRWHICINVVVRNVQTRTWRHTDPSWSNAILQIKNPSLLDPLTHSHYFALIPRSIALVAFTFRRCTMPSQKYDVSRAKACDINISNLLDNKLPIQH